MASNSVLTRQLPPWIGFTIYLLLAVAVGGLLMLMGQPGAIAVLLILGAIVGAIAQQRGRDFLDWFLYGFLVFPVALVHVLAAGRSTTGLRKCPHCAEMVKAEAKLCRYCQRELPAAGSAAPDASEAPASPPPGRFKSREDYERWKASRRH